MHKKNLLLLVILALFSAFIFTGCDVTPSTIEPPKSMEELVISDDFKFRTTNLYSVDEDLGTAYANSPISIYGSVYSTNSADQAIEDVLIGAGTTDAQGILSMKVTLPLSSNYIVFKTYDDSTEIRRVTPVASRSRALLSRDAGGASSDLTVATTEIITGTLAYEDMWPITGDYDFNDLVVQYKYAIGANKANEVVKIDMKYTLVASGAGFLNGLALALPVKSDGITLSKFTYSKAELNTTTAVVKPFERDTKDWSHILIFENQNKVMDETPHKQFNTGNNRRSDSQSVSFTLEFKVPISREILGPVPYDVFMLANNSKQKGATEIIVREVHLVDFPPTPLANKIVLSVADPLEKEKYYQTERNLPWALHIPGSWDYPLERKSIVDAYTRFGAWAESGGEKYRDWYLEPKYRNTGNIYDSSIDYSDL